MSLHSEIFEQPEVVRRLLAAEAQRAAEIGQALSKQAIRYVLIAARGTSDNAARYGQYLFGALNRLTVALAAPSLFSIYQRPPLLEGALVLGISQSGQSPDIVAVLQEARRQGAPTVALTNDSSSPLAAAAHDVLELHAGQEHSVAATKTYTAQLAALALLSLSLAGAALHASPLQAIPHLIEKALQAEQAAIPAAEAIARTDRCVVLGRGFNYATACEIALKMKELAYVAAEPYSSADFKHGPIALVEPGFPVILLALGQTMRAELLALRDELRQQRTRLVVLGDEQAPRRPDEAWLAVPAGDVPEWLTPLIAGVPGQLLAYYLALARGNDPDRPRTIGKITLTR